MTKTRLSREDLVGDGRGRAVGAFAEDAAAELVGVAAGDDVFGRGGNEDVALAGQQFVLVGGLALRRSR